jgi:hypothetical protein
MTQNQNNSKSEKLVLYDQMRVAIAQCAAIDEAAGIRDKAEKLRAYAQIRDDRESQQRFSEIRLRACQRIGELSRDLEKVVTIGGGKVGIPIDGKPKEQTLAEAGISTSTAQRYEELAGPKEEQAMHICAAATDNYFANISDDEVPTFSGLKSAVRSALKETFGEPVKRESKPRQPDLLVHFLYSADYYARNRNFDPHSLAQEVMEEFAQDEADACRAFIPLLECFMKELKQRFTHVK